jgi:hypothetical protein
VGAKGVKTPLVIAAAGPVAARVDAAYAEPLLAAAAAIAIPAAVIQLRAALCRNSSVAGLRNGETGAA